MLSINKTMEGIMAENNIGKITQVIGATEYQRRGIRYAR